MKKNYKFSIIVIMLFLASLSTYCNAQMPIGKDIKEANIIVKSLMAEGSFTLFKEKYLMTKRYNEVTGLHDLPGDKYIYQTYKEEISISLWYNQFDNVETIWFEPYSHEHLEKLKKVLHYDEWLYIRTFETFVGKRKVYTWKGYTITLMPDWQMNFSMQ
jgi:predicted small secreted protein